MNKSLGTTCDCIGNGTTLVLDLDVYLMSEEEDVKPSFGLADISLWTLTGFDLFLGCFCVSKPQTQQISEVYLCMQQYSNC